MNRRWIAYGLTGALGVAVLAGGAVAAANALDLRTVGGESVPGGVITGGDAEPAGDLGAGKATVDAPEGEKVSATVTAASTPDEPAAKLVSPVSPVTPPSAVTPASAGSADSAQSAVSN